MTTLDQWTISELFDDIIQGRGVKRTIHELEYDRKLYSSLFIERLQIYKYRPLSLSKIIIEDHYKAPAFYIHKNYALFGYVYWMENDEGQRNKIWASALKNAKGKSKYFLTHDPSKVLFVNLDLKERIEE